MKRIFTTLLCLSLLLSSTYISFSAAKVIPKDVLDVLNRTNFSNPKFDQSNELKKFNPFKNTKDGNPTVAIAFYEKRLPVLDHFFNKAEADQIFKKYQYREVIKPWTQSGKLDSKLGQAYTSEVYLLAGADDWFEESLSVKTWVKKVGKGYQATKIEFELTSSEPSQKAINFMNNHQAEINANSFKVCENTYEEYLETGESTTDKGLGLTMSSVENSSITLYGGLYGKGNIKDVNNGEFFKVATFISKDSNLRLSTQSLILGFNEKKTVYNDKIVEKNTGKVIPNNKGWILEKGIEYEYWISVKGEPKSGNNGFYYLSSDVYADEIFE